MSGNGCRGINVSQTNSCTEGNNHDCRNSHSGGGGGSGGNSSEHQQQQYIHTCNSSNNCDGCGRVTTTETSSNSVWEAAITA